MVVVDSCNIGPSATNSIRHTLVASGKQDPKRLIDSSCHHDGHDRNENLPLLSQDNAAIAGTFRRLYYLVVVSITALAHCSSSRRLYIAKIRFNWDLPRKMATLSPSTSPQSRPERPRAITSMSHASTRSHRSSRSRDDKLDLMDSARDKRRLEGTTDPTEGKSDPTKALHEAQPGMFQSADYCESC